MWKCVQRVSYMLAQRVTRELHGVRGEWCLERRRERRERDMRMKKETRRIADMWLSNK